MEEDAKDHEKTKEKLQLADEKNLKIVTINKEYEKKLREIELRQWIIHLFFFSQIVFCSLCWGDVCMVFQVF